MKDKTEKTKEIVDPDVYNRVDRGVDLFNKIDWLRKRMEMCEVASEAFKKGEFHVRIRNGNDYLFFDYDSNDNQEPPQIKKIFEQTISVMEAIYYAEMNAARKEFNNLLKTDKDGEKDTEK